MKTLLSSYLAALVLSLSITSQAEDRFAGVSIKTHKITDQLYMLEGAGGNIGVLTGKDGLLMIDDQFAPLADRIKAAIKTLGSDKPKYLLNTHYHGDHMGGNTAFGESSTIVAHANVRARLIADAAKNAAEPAPYSLPVFTYQTRADIYFNGEEVQLHHLPKGHTDGDTLVYFKNANVVHMGDHFFKDRFPYIDLGAGGSTLGLINNIESALTFIDLETKIIPGHGNLAGRADLVLYLQMLKTTKSAVAEQMQTKRSLQQILERGLDSKWQSWGGGFINEERWLSTLYNDLKRSHDLKSKHD